MSEARPKILLLGATGQVGWELARSLQPLGALRCSTRNEANFSAPADLEAHITQASPDVIVNAAAYTAVDQAEKEPTLAHCVNGEAPGALARAARRSGALLIHYSTDYVFAGTGERAWRSTDSVDPQNVYGHSKLAGERAIADAGGDWLTFRTSWVYAARGRNFVRTMLKLGAERDTLRVVADQIGAPTSARLIADATAQALAIALLERREGRFRSAIHHLCADGHTSWHGFAQTLFERWKMIASDQPVALRTLCAIPSTEYPTPARRPLNSRLDCSDFEARFRLTLPPWQQGLDLVLA
ncbi:MAG: dTDP-4-dehydrorhamnose reductase, partial [Betaproteobacteria bacterium]